MYFLKGYTMEERNRCSSPLAIYGFSSTTTTLESFHCSRHLLPHSTLSSHCQQKNNQLVYNRILHAFHFFSGETLTSPTRQTSRRHVYYKVDVEKWMRKYVCMALRSCEDIIHKWHTEQRRGIDFAINDFHFYP